MSRDKYILATRSVAAAPRSKRRGGAVAAASRSGGGGGALGGDYLTRAEFASYFELVNIGTDEAPRTAIHALYEGLYTDGFLSALGCKEGENEGGVSSLWELSDVSIPNPRNGDVLTYDGSKWIAKAPTATSGGLDKEELEAYLANKNYATQSWVTNKGYLTSASLYGYLTKNDASDLYLGKTEKAESAKVADKATILATARKLWGNSFDGSADINDTMIPASSATCGTSTSRWANVYSGQVDASTSIKIGGGTIRWNSAGYFEFDSGVASLSFVSALGVGVGLDSSVGSVSLWGNTFDGKNSLTGNITVDGDGSNPMVKVVKGGRDLSLHIGGSLNRGLWSGDLNKWIMYLQSDNTKILFADNIPVQATRFISSVGTGTAPFTVASTTRIANLNADMVYGFHAADLKGSGGGLTMQEILDGLGTSHVSVGALMSYGEIACDGDIVPVDSGACNIGEDTRPWAAGYFPELYIDGKKIDPNNLGAGGSFAYLKESTDEDNGVILPSKSYANSGVILGSGSKPFYDSYFRYVSPPSSGQSSIGDFGCEFTYGHFSQVFVGGVSLEPSNFGKGLKLVGSTLSLINNNGVALNSVTLPTGGSSSTDLSKLSLYLSGTQLQLRNDTTRLSAVTLPTGAGAMKVIAAGLFNMNEGGTTISGALRMFAGSIDAEIQSDYQILITAVNGTAINFATRCIMLTSYESGTIVSATATTTTNGASAWQIRSALRSSGVNYKGRITFMIYEKV